MGKKKLIVVWPYRFRDFDWQRFELEQLSPHVEIHVHELIDALTPEFATAYANQSEHPSVKRFSSLKEWRREFKKVSKDSVIFTHVQPTNLKSTLICITLRKSKTIGFLLGGVVLSETDEQIQQFAKLKRFYHFLRRNCLFFAMPDYVAVGGSESEERERRDFQTCTRIIHMNSFDYSQYLRGLGEDQSKVAGAVYLDTGVPASASDFLPKGQIELKKDLNVSFGVYLDNGFPGFRGDFIIRKIDPTVEPKHWYVRLNLLFESIEDSLSLTVHVLAHPKHWGRDYSQYFGSRKVIGNQTANFVKDATLVFGLTSTSISYAVLFNKPLILVTSDQIQNDQKQYIAENLANISAETGARIFNIDREYTEQELREALVIDYAKRESYKRKYLTSRTDDKPNYQVLLDEVINAVD